jgi:pre-mRNA cleavage complex 2 protein Pcf11
MTAGALKTFRPELLHALYDAQPNQCSTCGRRFLATDEGRAKKDRHLDWHFRTNQRMADFSIARGAHRDWFVSELEWVHLVEFDPSTTTASAAAEINAGASSGGKATTKQQQKKPEEQFVRAPPGVTRNTCSIDFEEMKSTYSNELQDWVFMNAAMFQGRIVHATCLAEMLKGQQQSSGVLGGGGSLAAALSGQGVRQRSTTPDSSLGKRKAEGSLMGGVGTRARVD